MTEVYLIRTVSVEDFLKSKDHLLELLPQSARQILNRFSRANDGQRSLLGEVIVRKIAAAKLLISPDRLEIAKTEKGKPFIVRNNGVHFNVSHSGEWVAVAFGDSDVGIDIEKIRRVDYRIAERYFSAGEKEQLNRLVGDDKLHFFFELWTMKESYLKLLGKGLTKSLGSFTVIKTGNKYNLNDSHMQANSVFFRQYPVEKDYKLAVCSFQNDFNEKIKTIQFGELVKPL